MRGNVMSVAVVFVCVIEDIAHAHNEVVLVGVSEHRIGDAVEEIGAALGQIHIVYIDEIVGVAGAAVVLAPVIFPPRTGRLLESSVAAVFRLTFCCVSVWARNVAFRLM